MDYRAWMDEWGVVSIESRLDDDERSVYFNMDTARFPGLNAVRVPLAQPTMLIDEADAFAVAQLAIAHELDAMASL